MTSVQLKVAELFPGEFARQAPTPATSFSPRTKQPMLVAKPAEVPETADCDSMSTRTVSSRGTSGKPSRPAALSRRALNAQAILQHPETSWRFLQSTGDFKLATAATADAVVTRSTVPETANTEAVTHQRAAPASSSAALSNIGVDEAEDVLSTMLSAARAAAVVNDPQLRHDNLRRPLGVPSPPSQPLKVSSRVSMHRDGGVSSSLSVPSVMSRDSRLAFLAKLPSCKFFSGPSPRQLQQRTKALVSEELRQAQPQAASHLQQGPQVMESVHLALFTPPDAHDDQRVDTDLDALMIQLQQHSESTVKKERHDLHRSKPSLVSLLAPKVTVCERGHTATSEADAGLNFDTQPQTPDEIPSSPSMSIVPGSRTNHIRRNSSHIAVPCTVAGGARKASPRQSESDSASSAASPQVANVAHALLMDSTRDCEGVFLNDVPLHESEELPFEVALTTRMELRRLYVALHPLDSIVPASNLPNELVSVLAVTHRGVAVPLLHEKHLLNGITSDSKSIAPPIYSAAVALDAVEYRQWHRLPGYVDPSKLIGSRDYDERCQLLAALRAKQREAEQRFGIMATYTKIPPPLLHDEELDTMGDGPPVASFAPLPATVANGMDRSRKKPSRFDPTLTQEIRRTGKVTTSDLAVLSKSRVQFLEEVAARLPNTALFDAFAAVSHIPKDV